MRLPLTLIASCALLAACGGGGGGGDSHDVAPSSGAITLTKSNYVDVAQEALSSSAYLLESSSLVLGAEVSEPDLLLRFAQGQMHKAPALFAKTQVHAAGAVHQETEQCSGGGSMTLTINDVNGNQDMDSGDYVSIVANQCVESGMVINGGLKVTFGNIKGEVGVFPYELAGTMEYNNLSVKKGQEHVVGNGSIVTTLKATANNQSNQTLEAPSFNATYNFAGKSTRQGLSNYKATVDVNAGATTTSANGTLTSSAFDSKSIRIETISPFVRKSNQANPYSGQAIISGAAGSKARITVVDTNSVKIELDADGNGDYEANTSKSWSELR